MIELRPQPIGIYAPPASNLLLPSVRDGHNALHSLLAGDLDIAVPAEWQFFVMAARGDVEKAMALLAGLDSPLAIYNRFVLMPTEAAFRAAQQSLSGELKELLEVAAYASGITDEIADSFSLDGELLALALVTRAASDIDNEAPSEAKAKLQAASEEVQEVSPLLASILLSQQADLMVSPLNETPALVIQVYREAIRLAGDCKLPMLLAELYTKIGMLFQNSANGQRGPVLEAVNSYQAALRLGISEEDHPEMFAQIQNNLGLAFLSTPTMEASNQLRTGIAVQSFRHALKIYMPETHPDMWASVSMNLANALQYAPTSHPEENLILAVETYEDVLKVRSRAKDPVAYATVLHNQANALSHLGMFKPALEKLAEAYKLFHWYEQIDQANASKDLVEQINLRLGDQDQPLEASVN